jgi:hypothetical protein
VSDQNGNWELLCDFLYLRVRAVNSTNSCDVSEKNLPVALLAQIRFSSRRLIPEPSSRSYLNAEARIFDWGG